MSEQNILLRVKLQSSVLVAASLMVSISAVALSFALGMMAAVAGYEAFGGRVRMAAVSYEEEWCGPEPGCAIRIASEAEFLSLFDAWELDPQVGEFYSGRSIYAVVPIPSQIDAFCSGHERCLRTPLFFNRSAWLSQLIRDHYPESFAGVGEWDTWNYFTDPMLWDTVRPGTENAVYRVVSIFRIRQSPDKYGLRIGYATDPQQRVWANQEIPLPTLEEISTLMSALDPLIDPPLYYYPTGLLRDYQEQARTWEAVGPLPFSVYYETLSADAVTTEDQYRQIASCGSIDAENCRMLYFAPLESRIDEYCQSFRAAGEPCLDYAKFANSAFWGFHHQAFLLLAPGQLDDPAKPGWLDLIGANDPSTAVYRLGSIWREPFEDFYRFNLEKHVWNQVYPCTAIQQVYDALAPNFSIGELAYFPMGGWGDDAAQEAAARTCLTPHTELSCPPPGEGDCRSIDVPVANYRIIFSEDAPPYEAYTAGTAYGTMKVLTLEQFNTAIADRSLSWQDIVAVDRTPFDVEVPLSGIITGTRQLSAASHVALRFARRNRPDAYRLGATAELAAWNGQLVKLVVNEREYQVTAATAEQVTAWQDANRPKLRPPQPTNRTYRTLDRVREITDEPTTALSRFGGKVSGLTKLYQIVPPRYQLEAFGIPFSYFYDFVRGSRITSTSSFPAQCRWAVTYEEFYRRLLADPAIMASPQARGNCLDAFWEYGKDHGTIPNVTLPGSAVAQNAAQVIGNRISELWNDANKDGRDDTTNQPIRVRFRSSSNMEDSIEFNGAGLYESRTVCLLDQYDADTVASCDSGEDHEETVAHALRDVWMSLYLPRAFEEREYWQLPQENVGMGILVNTGTPDERSNGVILTGDPAVPYSAGSEGRFYYITVQPGEASVVSPAEGEWPEIDVVETNVRNTYSIIRRQQASSEVTAGQYVLADHQLTLIAQQVSAVERAFPFDAGVYPRGRILLDLEFKFVPSGQLIFKQLRPFLVGEAERFTGTPVLPSTPSGVTAETAPMQVTVRWAVGPADALAVVERSFTGAVWNALDTVKAAAGTVTDTTVRAGSSYQYRVRFVNSFGASDSSVPVAVTVPILQCADEADNDGDGSIDLADPGCESLSDDDEYNEPLPQCADTQDNDSDGKTDLDDPGCQNAEDNDETDPPFRRGDVNGSGKVDISDAIFTLEVLFLTTTKTIQCDDAADSNDDGRVDISDAKNTLGFLFTSEGDITAPGPQTPGPDPTADLFGCRQYP